jgi:hypothetical protein
MNDLDRSESLLASRHYYIHLQHTETLSYLSRLKANARGKLQDMARRPSVITVADHPTKHHMAWHDV